MESDDDYNSFSPPKQPSPPPLHQRKLKRLKKSIQVSDEVVSLPLAESCELRDLVSQRIFEAFGGENELNSAVDAPRFGEDSKETNLNLDYADADDGFDGEMSNQMGELKENVVDLKMERFEKKRLREEESNESEGCDVGSELNSGFDGLNIEKVRKETKRVLKFDGIVDGFDRKWYVQSGGVEEIITDLKGGRPVKRRLNEEDSSENKGRKKKKKKKKSVKRDCEDVKPKTSSSNRRREEKERKIYLQLLHAESQRLLRETRDATFKPIPVVRKPISSVLEKIRQRKLEVSKKAQNKWAIAENNGNLMEGIMDFDSEVFSEEREVELSVEVAHEETIVCHAGIESGLDLSHEAGSQEAARLSSNENTCCQMAMDEQSMHAFRAPVDDTQYLFGDLQSSEGKDLSYNDQNNSPTEEVLAPSLLAINLKFDSAPADDTSDAEEYNDKENIDPDNGVSYPKGDPVKAFFDDEAVEEDDSDNGLLHFQESEEDDDIEDDDELKDLIASEYDEKPIDNERRNELHQKWLEQQDAAGTDNLLQRLKFGSKLKDTTLLEDDEAAATEDNGDDAEFGDEAVENHAKTSLVRMNSRKAKQMIPHLFSDMNDGYLSDGEETEKKLAKQRLLDKTEEHGTLLSPAKDESCKEVFGLIKKLNIVLDAKKKAKTSSFFDNMLTGSSSNGSSKSSFLGRATNHSLPSSHKKGTSTVRSFIFGRDDSNSRNSSTMSEDSSDGIPIENRREMNSMTKFSISQSKVSTQTRKDAPEAVSHTSLFEILKQSTVRSSLCNPDTTVGLTQTVYSAFKIPKKPIKIEGRT